MSQEITTNIINIHDLKNKIGQLIKNEMIQDNGQTMAELYFSLITCDYTTKMDKYNMIVLPWPDNIFEFSEIFSLCEEKLVVVENINQTNRYYKLALFRENLYLVPYFSADMETIEKVYNVFLKHVL